MIFTLAWRNIWRNKRRTLITTASISFAVFFSCIMQSTQLGSYERMIDNAVRFYTGYIQIHDKGYWDEKTIDNSFTFNEQTLESIIRTDEVTQTTPRLESFALASYKLKTKGALVIGIHPPAEHDLTSLKDKLIEGEYLEPESNGAMISEGLASYLNLNLYDTLVMIGQGYHGTNAAGKYPVTGIVKFPTREQNAQTIYLSLKEAQNFYAAPDQVTSVALGIVDPKEVDKVTADIRKIIDTGEYEVMDWKEMLPALVQSIELDYRSGLILLYVLYAVVGFGMFGTFMMMTEERKHEFGIMLAVGMKRLRMQRIVFFEIAMLALLGVICGIILSLPVIIYFYINPITFSGDMAQAFDRFGIEPIIPFSLDPRLFYNQAWVILIMTGILGIYPLLAIKRLEVVKAMRE